MNCTFCGKKIEKGTENIFVTKRGETRYFCSGKCEKNMTKLKRKARHVKWTASYREEKELRTKSSTTRQT